MSRLEGYRKSLADEVRGLNSRKEKRNKIEAEKGKGPDYWYARQKKISEVQPEDPLNGGLGILLKKKTLYHGSVTSGIKEFKVAQENTIGNGVYLTSYAHKAVGYGDERAKGEKESKPSVIYEVSIENLKILDLRKDKNVKVIMSGFADTLRKKFEELESEKTQFSRRFKSKIKEALEYIDNDQIRSGNVRDGTYDFSQWFTEYIISLGYDGLVSFEGGDGNVGSHDSYVIFDPKNIKINQEQQMFSSNSFIRHREDDEEVDREINSFNKAETL